jgi:hypothetical protein
MIQPSLQIGGGDWAVKETKLLGTNPVLNEKLPVEIDVTNSTIGTRVNEEGFIQNGPRNLLTFSEEIDNGAWSKAFSNVATNVSISPNGNLTADRINGTNTSVNYFRVFRNNLNLTSGIYTFSFYIRNNNLIGYVIVSFLDTLNNNSSEVFDYSSTNLGDWTRVSASINTATTTLNNLNQIRVDFRKVSGNVTGIENIEFWGAQLEQGSVATEYYPTTTRTNLARIDYSSGEAALLVEQQRTNLITYSSNLITFMLNGITRTLNVGIAPDGTQTASEFNFATAGAVKEIATAGQDSDPSNKVYTGSVYVKGILGEIILFTVDSNGQNGTQLPITMNGEWQRISATRSYLAGSTPSYFRIGNRDLGSGITGTTTIVQVWGAQLEQGSYATSYIPTLASAVTRNADLISKSGINDLDISGNTETFLFGDVVFRDNSNLSGFDLYTDNQNKLTIRRVTVAAGVGGTGYTLSSFVFIPNIRYKILVKYKNNDSVVFINGVKGNVLTSIPYVKHKTLTLNVDTSIPNNISIRSLSLYKTALTDAQCIQLTTP